MDLPKGSISSFVDQLEKFVTHFSFNLEKDINTLDLLKEKQREGETFASYLQRWCALASHLKSPLNEEMVTIFVTNAHPDMAHNLSLHCVITFLEVIEKGTIIERALIAKGKIKIYNPDKDKSSRDKSCYWNKNKNFFNDGVTDTKNFQVAKTSQRSHYILLHSPTSITKEITIVHTLL